MSRCKCGVPQRNENWQLDGCEELRGLKSEVERLKAVLARIAQQNVADHSIAGKMKRDARLALGLPASDLVQVSV